jgi:hypothetical protein
MLFTRQHQQEQPLRRRSSAWWPVVVIAAGVLLNGCGPMPAVQLQGDAAGTAALAGEWDGSFEGHAAGRNGSIWFKLVAGEDHAHGDVLMKSNREPVPYARYSPTGAAPPLSPPTFLSIHFVRISGQAVNGVLDTYLDPSCDCQAWTTFSGVLFENQIRGTFVTHLDDDTIITGAWHVTRRPPAR